MIFIWWKLFRSKDRAQAWISSSFIQSIKENAEILTGAVGLITEKDQAEEVLDNHEADVIFLGRELLRNPYWTLYASGEIDEWPLQYQRSFEGSKKINYIRED